MRYGEETSFELEGTVAQMLLDGSHRLRLQFLKDFQPGTGFFILPFGLLVGLEECFGIGAIWHKGLTLRELRVVYKNLVNSIKLLGEFG